jgi:hypothetical protein
MVKARQREIVIEFEKVLTIRKRARTTLVQCKECRKASDAVSLHEACELFETTCELLFQFVVQNNGHYHLGIDDRVYLCVPSLLEIMSQSNARKSLTARGENV